MSRRRKPSPAASTPSAASSGARASSPASGGVKANSSTLRQCLLASVCVLVGIAVRIAGGNYHPAAIALIAVAILLSLVAIGNPRGLASRGIPPRVFAGVLASGIIAQVVALLVAPIIHVGGSVDTDAIAAMGTGLVGVAIGATICGVATFTPSRGRLLAVVGIVVMLLSHVVAGISAVRAAVPPMDVIVFQDLAVQTLLEGGNPYAMTFPDLSGGTSPHYGPGLQADGKLLFGFPYPPLSLFTVVPATVLAGDFRFGHALCVTLVGATIALTRRSPTSGLAAALFLLTPTGLLVMVNGWTEPLVTLLLAVTVCVAVRAPNLIGVPLGLFWAVKQYVPLTAPLMWLLPPAEFGRSTKVPGVARWKTLLTAFIIGSVVTLPLVLMDFPAFWHSAIALQLQQPFRDDALSLQTSFYRMTGSAPPSWPAFAALAVVQALAIWRMPRTAAGFAGAMAATLLVFFALSKQAFANYYFLVIAAGALAVSLDGGDAAADSVA